MVRKVHNLARNKAARVEDDPELQAFFTEAETLMKNPKE